MKRAGHRENRSGSVTYYERIIRNEQEFNAIRQYILDNPKNWAKDNENPARQGLGADGP